jgi:hypothetical protein
VCVRECDLDRKAPAGGGPSERKYVDLKRSFVVSLPRKLGRACPQSKDVWVPWFLKGDCTPTATPHAKEIDVRIEPFLRSEEVSVRNVHDGVIRAEVSEGSHHECSLRCLLLMRIRVMKEHVEHSLL